MRFRCWTRLKMASPCEPGNDLAWQRNDSSFYQCGCDLLGGMDTIRQLNVHVYMFTPSVSLPPTPTLRSPRLWLGLELGVISVLMAAQTKTPNKPGEGAHKDVKKHWGEDCTLRHSTHYGMA